ncbi:MAG: hypothetical protein PHC34_09705 [Candidatus Gastranaerophilales bacterium]|nr:hypothetical protein [Candidatus Gastranaerophilales bacterium]
MEDILNLLLEEEKYYIEIDSSRHPWIDEFLEYEVFHKDLVIYIKEIQRKLEYKEKQKPYLEKQKEYLKDQRKFLREKKMSKQPPTPKQVAYYKALCHKLEIDIKTIDLENASRLDLKNALDALLNEEGEFKKQNILLKLQNIVKTKEEEF